MATLECAGQWLDEPFWEGLRYTHSTGIGRGLGGAWAAGGLVVSMGLRILPGRIAAG